MTFKELILFLLKYTIGLTGILLLIAFLANYNAHRLEFFIR